MSTVILGALIALLVLCGCIRRINVYDVFIAGAKQGLETALHIAPFLVAVLCVVSLVNASGLMAHLCVLFKPVMDVLRLPSELTPLFLMRPLSGSASMGILESTFQQVGVDSYAGRVASVICGANETIFYLSALYLGAAGVKKSRYIIPCALAAYAVGCAGAALACKLL